MRTYTNLDALESEQSTAGTISYAYDAAGRRTGATVVGQPEVTYTYDDADRLVGIVRGTVNVALSYDDANRLKTVTLPAGSSERSSTTWIRGSARCHTRSALR